MYGSAYDAFKLDFIQELHSVFYMWDGPTMIGGDFNLVREACDKNTREINQHWVDLFNEWINKFGLIELKNAGRKFTWGNNQDSVVMATLDRVFITVEWESLHPNIQVKALPRVASDHTPLVVDTCATKIPKNKIFRFEKWCLEVDGFREVVI